MEIVRGATTDAPSLTGKGWLRLEPKACRDFLHRHAGGVDDGELVVLEQPLGGDDFLAALLKTGVAAVGVARLADGGEAFRRQGQSPQPGQVGEQDAGQALLRKVVRSEERRVGKECRSR